MGYPKDWLEQLSRNFNRLDQLGIVENQRGCEDGSATINTSGTWLP